MAFDNVTGNAKLLRNAGRTTKDRQVALGASLPGTWDVLAHVSGIPDERRADIVDGLRAKYGDPDAPAATEPNPEGLLKMTAQADGLSLAGAAEVAVVNFNRFLIEAGVTSLELLTSEAFLQITPADREIPPEPKGLRARAARKLGKFAHGLDAASQELRDLDARQEIGDLDYDAHALLTNLSDAAQDRLMAAAASMGGQTPVIVDGMLSLEVQAARYASPIQVLSRAVQALTPALVEADNGASFHLIVGPVLPEDEESAGVSSASD